MLTPEESGVANPAAIDIFGVDHARNEIVLVMNETRRWDGGDSQLHELQEKFNAYASFLLDGEMAAAHPELAGKKARIELCCREWPNERALVLLESIHDQLALQEIAVEVVVKGDATFEPGLGSGTAGKSAICDSESP